ncbi:hypothetical protein ACOSQ4_014038 [Xanthoceras sorbifolium]
MLEKIYSQKSMAKVLQLKQQLQNTKKGSLSINDYFLKIKTLREVLKVAGQTVIDYDLVLSVMSDLGHDYDPVRQFQHGSTQQPSYSSFNSIQQPPQAHFNTNSSAYFASPDSVQDPAWYMDSGATNHVTSSLGNLSIQSYYNGNERLTVGNGQQLPIAHIGSSYIVSHTQPASILQLKDVLHVPNITKNLLSISKFTKDNNACAEFYDNHFVVKDKVSRKVLLHGQLRNGLYQLEISYPPILKKYETLTGPMSVCLS